MLTVGEAIEKFYEVAVRDQKRQSGTRLQGLGEFCVQELAARGMPGALMEQEIPGGGRQKNWDVAWKYDGKFRLAISLKSILKNLSGTVPNRVDDLMGEVANAQLYSPEIVIGYIMLIDVSQDSHSPKHQSTWAGLLRTRLGRLSSRKPPNWTIGTFEAHVVAEVDFSESPKLLSDPAEFMAFFDMLADQVRNRNPNALPPVVI